MDTKRFAPSFDAADACLKTFLEHNKMIFILVN